MRQDGDFTAYADARWTSLVRTLVVLGAPLHVAESVTRTALARCHRDWRRRDELDDVDAHVYRTLLDSRRDDRTAWWQESYDAGPSDLLPPALEKELDRLPPSERAALALRAMADLSPQQVAAVVGATSVEPPSSLDLDELRAAGERIMVPPPPVGSVLTAAREQRRVRRRNALTAVVAVAAVVGLGSWFATRPAPVNDDLEAAAVKRETNPAPVTWYANGLLHLDDVKISVTRVNDLAAVEGGAVYGDALGAVVFATADGARDRLGSKDPSVPLVASDEDGLAAWVDPSGDRPELVVYELTGREVILRRPLPPDSDEAPSRPIAIDGGTVYWADSDGDHELVVSESTVVEGKRNGLLDVASEVRVYQDGPESLRLVQPLFDIELERPGIGAQLSPDGNFVLTRTPGLVTGYGDIRIYDARSGDELDNGLTPADVAIAAELGPETVTYIVGRAVARPDDGDLLRLSFSGTLDLRTCRLSNYLEPASATFLVELAAPHPARAGYRRARVGVPPEKPCKTDATFPSSNSLSLLSNWRS